ncbi:hypothetical protein CsatB_024946 [Cannabis sativa]
MAVTRISDFETMMGMKQNPDGKKAWPKTELQNYYTNPNKKKKFQPKANNSVINHGIFLPKKRLVKTMMFKYIVKKFSVIFHGRESKTTNDKFM